MPCYNCRECGRCIRAAASRRRCVSCHEPIGKKDEVCPHCGKPQPLPPGRKASSSRG